VATLMEKRGNLCTAEASGEEIEAKEKEIE
jgi:hypothetical protein